MSAGSAESYEDPWAWLHAARTSAPPDYRQFHVVAGVLPVRGEPQHQLVREALADQGIDVEIRDDLRGDADGDWIWVVPDDTVPTEGSLTALLDRVRAEPDAAVIGSLLIEPRRRGAGTIISDWAQTITKSGRVRPLTDPGEFYQGQLDAVRALGVPAGGMLVRGDAWRFLGGLNEELPRDYWGLDFGWRANLAGYRVIAEPRAQLVDHSEYSDDAHLKAAGLALVSGNTPAARRWLTMLRLIVGTLFTAVGLLLGKDPRRAGDELRGLARWLRDGSLRRGIAERVASLPVTPEARRATQSLRPKRGAGLRRSVELVAARLAEWVRTFTGRSGGVSLDEMTGDEFAEVGSGRYALPLAASGALVLLLGGLAAARGTFGAGSLAGAQLLPAPGNWTQLVDAYVAPIAGAPGISGAPWTALAGLLSFVAMGNPEWLVTGTLLLAVPVSWLLAFRLLRQLVADRRLAGVAALAYALAPAVLGGLNAGAFGLAAMAMLLPILGYSLWHWLVAERWSWRRAGAVAFWLLLACALVPAAWLGAVVAAIWTAIRARSARAWAQWALVLAAPGLLLVGGWGGTLLRFPGRLLTGIEPALTPAAAPDAWLVLIGRATSGAPPLWVSIVFFAACWLAAFIGAARRPGSAGLALFAGGVAAVVAMVLSRLVVELPLGVWARPQGLEWQLALVAGLVLAASLGLDGMLGELRGHDLGLRHLATLGLALFGAVAIAIGAGWWVLAGQVGLTRSTVGNVPAFVRNAQDSATPGRTLYLEAVGDQIAWALLEDDFPRLGDSERGIAFSGSTAARDLAGSVAARLVGDSADDQILPDLVTLGVSNVVLTGGNGAQQLAIDNAPGLGQGTGNATQFVWPVPDSGIVLAVDGARRQLTGAGQQVAAGSAERVLRLAQPRDPRWQVRLGDTPLTSVDGGEPGGQFALGAASGQLSIDLDAGSPAWRWVQLAGLALLGVLAAPSVRRREELGPRRAAGGAQ
ncbi:MAG TPA: hypothetical protein PLL50_02110 [Propionicimonas sp.]|nr:hypothetical protein [Propionicimonas sp.]HQD96335.1 hypothetical protein [Propionicimonas sp.]